MKDIPLLLIHGFPFEHSMWYGTIAALGSAARVLAPDLPGFGKNPVAAREDPSLEVMADFLAQFLDENSQPKTAIAGMSMGGYVALAFAEKYPERVSCLGLISSQTAADSPEAREGRYATISKIRAGGPSVVTDAMLPKLFGSARAKAALEEFAIQGASAAGVEGLCWALEAMAKRPDRTEFLQRLDLPVLVAHGTEDQIVPFNKARQLAESCRKPLFVEMPRTGHASPLESPDRVASGLARLLEACRAEERGTATRPR